MKYSVTILSASLTLACIMPTYVLAVDDDPDASSTLEQRRALSNRIKKLREIRKKLPIPVPSGLFGIYAFPEKGQGVAGINYQHHEFDGLIQGTKSVSAKTVVTTAPNRFFGDPMQPPTLRVVPKHVEKYVGGIREIRFSLIQPTLKCH